jgi:hypothetical protein
MKESFMKLVSSYESEKRKFIEWANLLARIKTLQDAEDRKLREEVGEEKFQAILKQREEARFLEWKREIRAERRAIQAAQDAEDCKLIDEFGKDKYQEVKRRREEKDILRSLETLRRGGSCPPLDDGKRYGPLSLLTFLGVRTSSLKYALAKFAKRPKGYI